MSLLVARTGAELVHVGNGAEALDVASQQHFDLILMDMQMPLLNGLDAARQILEHWPDARIIMNSAFGDQALIDEASSVGIADYITKDQRPSALVRAVLAAGTTSGGAR